MGGMDTPTVEQLVARLREIDDADDVSAIALARRLVVELPTALQVFADARTYDLTRTASRADVAAMLGVGRQQVGNAVHRHVKRIHGRGTDQSRG